MSGTWDGRPENPERSGWRWLHSKATGWVLHWWSANAREYRGGGDAFGPDWATRRWAYGGPCLTPAEIAARETQMREALEWIAGKECHRDVRARARAALEAER